MLAFFSSLLPDVSSLVRRLVEQTRHISVCGEHHRMATHKQHELQGMENAAAAGAFTDPAAASLGSTDEALFQPKQSLLYLLAV